MGYTKNAISGFSWETAYKVGSTLISFIKILVLARLLSPDDFGLFSLTAIALGITENFTQTGVNLTILQSKQSIDYFLNTAWVIAILRGLTIGIIMVLLGMGMSRFFNEPQLLTLIGVAALVPIIKGFINPAIVTLQKEFRFFKGSIYRFSLTFIEGLLAVVFALIFKSVWALVFAIIGSAIFEVIISFIFFKERPIFRYLSSRAKVIFANAKWLGLASFLNYLDANIDDFILGRMVGTYNLGIYHNAYALSHRVNFDLSKSVQHGAIPVFTKIAQDKQRLNRAFTRSFLATLGISIVISLPFFIFPEFAINILLGDKWLETIPLLRPLIFAGILQSLSLSAYSYLLAKKDYLTMNLHLGITLIIMIGFILFLGATYGLIGAVIGIGLSRLIAAPFLIYKIKKDWHEDYKK